MYTTLLAFRNVTQIEFIKVYIQKIQTHLAAVAKLVGQLNSSHVDSHRNSIKISYGRPLPQRVCVRSTIKPATISVKLSKILLTMNSVPTRAGASCSTSVQ